VGIVVCRVRLLGSSTGIVVHLLWRFSITPRDAKASKDKIPDIATFDLSGEA
jgi:hypothetical protein